MFDGNLSPKLVESIPGLLAARTVSVRSAARGVVFDLDVSGIGFRLAADRNTPISRKTVSIQKQQFDTSKEAGEQSLDGYWLRSQASFHNGNGIVYYEPGTEEDTQFRFASSFAMDVTQLGKAQPLLGYTLDQAMGGNCWVYPDGAGSVVYASPTGLQSGGYSTSASFSLTDGGVNYDNRTFVFGKNIVIQTGLLGVWNASTNAIIASRTSDATAANMPGCWWVKGRLIVSIGPKLFEVPLTGTAVDLNTATPLFTHPSSTYVWTAVVDAPGAILACGNEGDSGTIYRFALQDASSGQTPKLSQAYQVAQLPLGEGLTAACSYLGRYLALGTSAGIRVAVIDTDSNVTYGPLLTTTSGTVGAICAHGDTFYCATNHLVNSYAGTNEVGIIVIDLARPIGSITDLRFAISQANSTGLLGSQVPSSIAWDALHSQPVLAVPTSGFWRKGSSYSTATLTTGRIRMGTTTDKVWRYLDLSGSVSSPGTLVVEVWGSDGVLLNSVTMNSTTGVIGFGLDSSRALEWVSVTFRMSGGAVSLSTLRLEALPKVKREWLFTYPLHLRDMDSDRNSQVFGGQGFGYARWQALTGLMDSTSVVTITDQRTGETYPAIIEDLSLEGITNPEKGASNFGGIIQLVVRRL